MRGIKIHDIEMLTNLFLYCDIDRDTGKENVFMIWDGGDDPSMAVNDLFSLCSYLVTHKHKLVGYNSHGYDGPMLTYIIHNVHRLQQLTISALLDDLYAYSQQIIANTQYGGKPTIPPYLLANENLDLFKLWHFDNANRWTRLKDLQVAMNWHKVQDMPIKYYERIIDKEALTTVISYCKNDIYSTLEFYKRSRKQIDLRRALTAKYGINLMSANDPKIGSEIFAKLLSQEMNISTRELKSMRTYRESINLGEILLPCITFDTPLLRGLLDTVRNTVITNTKGGFKQKLKLGRLVFAMGLGGIHACTRAGRYDADDKYGILDIDVKSFYPNLAIVNGLYPEHLGSPFCTIFKMIFDDRSKIPKKDPTNYAYKIILNGVYGKSNESTSYFYDPRFTMQITINGQLLILMLSEKILSLGADILQANTDGITILYAREKEEEVMRVCREWALLTNLQLEYAQYSSMIIKDVSNYIAIGVGGDVKYKGAFKLFDINNPDFKEWNENPSFRIVGQAISEYFINGIALEDTIRKCTDVFQFIGRAKFQSDSDGETRCYTNGNIIKEQQQKTTRYLVTNKGCSFYKIYVKGSEEVINKGYQVTIYNNHIDQEFSKYDINYKFYIEEAKKVVNIIEGNKQQLCLF